MRDILNTLGGAKVIGRFKGVSVHCLTIEVASEATLMELAVGMIVI